MGLNLWTKLTQATGGRQLAIKIKYPIKGIFARITIMKKVISLLFDGLKNSIVRALKLKLNTLSFPTRFNAQNRAGVIFRIGTVKTIDASGGIF